MGDLWIDVEFIHSDMGTWITLLSDDRPYRHLFMTQYERARLRSLPKTLRVYRGYTKGRARRGLSWTLSKNRARFLAIRPRSGRTALLAPEYYQPEAVGMVARGTCAKSDVVAYKSSRREQEVVVMPDRVRIDQSEEV